MSYPTVSVSSNVFQRTASARHAERFVAKQVLAMVPIFVPPALILRGGGAERLRSRQNSESDAAKTVLWPGATPF